MAAETCDRPAAKLIHLHIQYSPCHTPRTKSSLTRLGAILRTLAVSSSTSGCLPKRSATSNEQAVEVTGRKKTASLSLTATLSRCGGVSWKWTNFFTKQEKYSSSSTTSGCVRRVNSRAADFVHSTNTGLPLISMVLFKGAFMVSSHSTCGAMSATIAPIRSGSLSGASTAASPICPVMSNLRLAPTLFRRDSPPQARQ